MAVEFLKENIPFMMGVLEAAQTKYARHYFVLKDKISFLFIVL